MTKESRNRIILGIMLLILLVAFTLFVIFLFSAGPVPPAASRTSSPAPSHEKTPPAVAVQPSTWGSSYYYGGMPRQTASFSDTLLVLTNTGYVVGYDENKKEPAWVCYRLFATSNHHAPPRPKDFRPDNRTAARVVSHSYAGSGYDRGHMAPNHAIAVCYGAEAQQETFLMSNIIPQRPNLNRRVWEHIERQELDQYAAQYGQVWVIVGPVFGRDRLPSGVAVPSACFKILVEEYHGAPKVLALLIPQDVEGSEQPAQFLTSVEDIQRETRLDFFADMPAEIQGPLEHERAKGMW